MPRSRDRGSLTSTVAGPSQKPGRTGCGHPERERKRAGPAPRGLVGLHSHRSRVSNSRAVRAAAPGGSSWRPRGPRLRVLRGRCASLEREPLDLGDRNLHQDRQLLAGGHDLDERRAGVRQRGPDALAQLDRLIRCVTIPGYLNVNAYALAPGSRNVISRVRSWDRVVLAHELVQAAVPAHAVPVLVDVRAV
jgi:hypothetical protein